MITQQQNVLTLTFPTTDSAKTFAAFLRSLLNLQGPETSSPPSEPLQAQDSLAPQRSRHTVLTPERMDQIAEQRASGQSANQRILRAQTQLRDGVLPFSKPGAVPPPSGQPSPRILAQQQGRFADGAPKEPALRAKPDPQPQVDGGDPPEAERRGSRLRISPSPSQQPSKS